MAVTCRIEDNIATIAMADTALQNALSKPFVDGLEAAFAAAQEAHAVVLTGLPTMFCSGASFQTLAGVADGTVPLGELDVPRLLLTCPVPVVAAMRGDAIGGGFVLGLGADVIVMAEEARYGLNFMAFGLTPGLGATSLAADILGGPVAAELMYSAEFRKGRDFRGIGAINAICPAQKVEPVAFEKAARIADKPRAALVSLKRHLAKGRLAAFAAARKDEVLMHERVLRDADTQRRLKGLL